MLRGEQDRQYVLNVCSLLIDAALVELQRNIRLQAFGGGPRAPESNLRTL